jgi:hypothetical protein
MGWDTDLKPSPCLCHSRSLGVLASAPGMIRHASQQRCNTMVA